MRISDRPMDGQRLLSGSVLQRQIEVEAGTVRAGARHYEKACRETIQRGEGASLRSAERLLVHWFQPLKEAIAKSKAAWTRGHSTINDDIWGPAIKDIKSGELAVIIMHESVSACMLEPAGIPALNLCYNIGRAVFAEHHRSLMRRHDRAPKEDDEEKLWKALTQKFKNITPRRVNWWARKQLDTAITSKKAAIHIGAHLFNLLRFTASTTDYVTHEQFVPAFRRDNRAYKNRRRAYVKMTDEAWALIDASDAARRFLRPRHMAMMVPPYPWGPGQPGGYINNRMPLVIKSTKLQRDTVASAKMPLVYEGHNALGMAAWQINRRLESTQNAVWERGWEIADIPSREDRAKPPRPETFTDEEAEKAWKIEATKVHRQNIQMRGRRLAFLAKMGLAAEYRTWPAVYFPHNLCFRNRAYAVPLHLNRQGDDLCRGLLEFGREKKPDTTALQIHAANCWGHGIDKGTFEERAEWTRTHASEIGKSATHPLETTGFWSQADSPWQFLAACMGLDDPETAGARLPVHRDGSCNGLQHYAALGRDEVGGAAVNILDSDRPSNLYGQVAGTTKSLAEAMFGSGDKREALAHILAPLISRPVIKQPVMTTVYDVTLAGAREQLISKLRERGLEGKTLYQASQLLAELVFAAVGEVCRSARAIMDWIKQCARLIVEAGHPLAWTTPLGFPVAQGYRSQKMIRVRTVVSDFRVAFDSDTLPLRMVKQVRGAAPNFIHSIDASHMFMVAAAARRADIDFGPVHDSFASHAADFETMGEITREKFVELHREPILARLHEEWSKKLQGVALPTPPPPGDLDIELCRHARYMFS